MKSLLFRIRDLTGRILILLPRPLCRFCCVRESAVESHIIPRAFILAMSEPNTAARLLSNRFIDERRSWTGLYDGALVCAECEAIFSPYDTYGHRFFYREQLNSIHDDGELLVYTFENADAAKLKLFVLCNLWRASASTRPEFRSVDLGRWEPEIRDMIKTGDPGAPDRFPVILVRFQTARENAVPAVYPYRADVGGLPCYKMIMAGCTASVVIQGRALPPILSEVVLAAGRPVILFPKVWETSEERRRIMNILRQNKAAKAVRALRRRQKLDDRAS
jgi:hypothetical protein